jgi:LPS O-antigen subunit length determinant protein (WzzB/FepE family)
MTKEDMPQIIKGDEIDLVALFKIIWGSRKTIYYSLGICFLLGIIIAFTSPTKYTASATLLPSSEENSSNLGGLSSLAGLAGVNIGSMVGNNSGIDPALYPQVVQSIPYLMELMNTKIRWNDFQDSLSFSEKMKIDLEPGVIDYVAKYTIGLPSTIKAALFPKRDTPSNMQYRNSDIYSLSEQELIILKQLRAMIVVEVDSKSGLVTLTGTNSEPFATAEFTSAAINLLQKHVIAYRIQKALDNYTFLKERYDELSKTYDKSQEEFFAYKDANRFIINERMNPEYQKLSDAYEIASAVYKNIAQQLEQAKITVKQATPVFKVLEPVVVPIEKSSPKRLIIILVSAFVGGFIGFGIVFGQLIWLRLR